MAVDSGKERLAGTQQPRFRDALLSILCLKEEAMRWSS